MPPPHPPEFRKRAVELARERAKPVPKIAAAIGISESWGSSHRSSEEEALAGLTAERPDLGVLLGGLDAFGHHGHTQQVPHLDDGGNDHRTGGVLGQVGGEPWSILTTSTGNRLR